MKKISTYVAVMLFLVLFFENNNAVHAQEDFGDAPDPTYPTLLINNGARHTLVGSLFLGFLVDSEPDGQPNAFALGDDANGLDDEDGVVFTSALAPGSIVTMEIVVMASAAPKLNAWIDFNADGDWDDPGEQIFTDQVMAIGPNTFLVPIPAGATPGLTYARFRLNSLGGLTPMGAASDGEVEDYIVQIDSAAPPTANDDSATAVLNMSVTIDVAANDSDSDGDLDPSSAVAVSGPSNGSLVNNGDGTFDYTPNLNFTGSDSFTYLICDLAGHCNTATVTITVTPIFGGVLTGMTPQKITCQTPGQRDVIENNVKIFDCSLIVNQGQRVRITIEATAD